MSKLKVKTGFSIDPKVMTESIKQVFAAMEKGEKEDRLLSLRERLFWIDKGLEFYKEFYNKGINCEKLSWKLLDSIIDYLYYKDPDVKEELDKWYPPDSYHVKKYGKFRADKFFGDEMDVVNVRKLLEAAKKNIEKEIRKLSTK